MIYGDVKISFGPNLKLMAEAMGVTKSWLLMDQMRLLCQDMIKITAPSKKTIMAVSKNTGKDWGSDFKIGKDAVASDLRRIFMAVNPSDKSSEDDRLAQMEVVGIPATVFRSKSGAIYGVEKTLIDFSGSKMASHHAKYRSKRTGRVTRAGSETRDIGRWKFVDKLAVKRSVFNRYLKGKQKDVGILKAGWVKPAKHYQSIVGGRLSVPSFVARNVSKAQSSIQEMKAGGELVLLSVTNRTPMASIKIDRGAIGAAVRTREKDLAGQVLKRFERTVAQFNAGKVPTPQLKEF